MINSKDMFNELNESLNKLGISCCKASEALNKLCNALYTSPSNNWLKMHGYPMRRKKKGGVA